MEIYDKKQQINTLKEGDSIKDIFVVKIKKDFKQYAKGYSFTLILTDSSGGSLDLKFWGDTDESKVRQLWNLVLKKMLPYRPIYWILR
tara:strand:+ start:2769 stop:3032 length:264 start_codon:yes stop_codon:yes gene_type:complete